MIIKNIGVRLYFLFDRLVYGSFIKLKKSYKSNKAAINEANINSIKEINKSAYNPGMIMYDEMMALKDIEDFYDYLGCWNPGQIEMLVKEDYYILLIVHFDSIEIVDFAAKNGKCLNIFDVIAFLRYNAKKWHKNKMWMIARESTAYRLIKLFEKRKVIQITSDYSTTRCNEPFHIVKFRVPKEMLK